MLLIKITVECFISEGNIKWIKSCRNLVELFCVKDEKVILKNNKNSRNLKFVQL